MDSFEKMKYMADNDLDICLAPVTNIVEWKKANGGAHVVIGIPESLLQRKLRGDVFCGGLVLMEKEQFDRVPFDKDKPKESYAVYSNYDCDGKDFKNRIYEYKGCYVVNLWGQDITVPDDHQPLGDLIDILQMIVDGKLKDHVAPDWEK